ncbi:MAG: CAP domain-containing protein [Lachnospiraceae bacterium]|nr:CAP domain-containing protein [Lachnospiraceae bacterium]
MRQRLLTVLLVLAFTVSVSAGYNSNSEISEGRETSSPSFTVIIDPVGNIDLHEYIGLTEENTDTTGNFSLAKEDTYTTGSADFAEENTGTAGSAAVLEENTDALSDTGSSAVSIPEDETVTIQTSTEAVTGTFHYEEAYKVLTMVNEHREEIGIPLLTWDENMKEASQIRAAEATLSWSHTRPNGEPWYTVSSLVKGENLAKGYNSAEDVFAAWMESDGHRENMEWVLATTIYVAYFETATGGYWSMELGY